MLLSMKHLALSVAILLSSQVSAAADPAAKTITITGQLNSCYKLKHPQIQLKAVLPITNKHVSAVVPVKPDGHFSVQGTTADLPKGRYEIDVGDDANSLDGSGSVVDIRDASADAGVVGDCDAD